MSSRFGGAGACRCPAWCVWLLAALLPCLAAAQSETGAFEHWDSYRQKIQHRSVIDAFGREFLRVESMPRPVVPAGEVNRSSVPVVKLHRSELGKEIAELRGGLEESIAAPAGFVAPILDDAGDVERLSALEGLASVEDEGLWAVVETLPEEGLLRVLAGMIEKAGSARVSEDPEQWVERFARAGAPMDWVACFRMPDEAGPDEAPEAIRAWVVRIAGWLRGGQSLSDIQERLSRAEFSFRPTREGFRVADESGMDPAGLVRLQLQGGYSNGLTPGGALHVAQQVALSLPRADLLLAAPDGYLSPIRAMVNSWDLDRERNVDMVVESVVSTAWAQDSAKAGFQTGGEGRRAGLVTLAPRFASQGEEDFKFWPHESFLMDGLARSGHEVIHSPLLFQGGNLLMIWDAVKDERVLLISETTIYRNLRLGLTREQVLESFRREFDAARCVPLPMVSYHLDYDVTVRATANGPVVFVNDAVEGAKRMVRAGLKGLVRAGVLTEQAVQTLAGQLESGNVEELARGLGGLSPEIRNGQGELKASFAGHFSVGDTDAGDFNLQVFLAAFDVLSARFLEWDEMELDQSSVEYFEALQAMVRELDRQRKVLEGEGWKVVLTPSLPDLRHSINYINGVHVRGRFLMPAIGGLYRGVDEAVEAVYREAFGPGVEIVRIATQELQRQHGAVHCVASVYPARAPAVRM